MIKCNAPCIADVKELGELRQFVVAAGDQEFVFEDPGVVEKLNQVMDAYGKSAIDLVKTINGTSLDYTAASLKTLEDVVASIVKRLSVDAALASDEALLVTLCHKFGAYLGEVIRRLLGGEWTLPAHGDRSIELRFANGFRCSPSLQIFAKLRGDTTATVETYFQEVKHGIV